MNPSKTRRLCLICWAIAEPRRGKILIPKGPPYDLPRRPFGLKSNPKGPPYDLPRRPFGLTSNPKGPPYDRPRRFMAGYRRRCSTTGRDLVAETICLRGPLALRAATFLGGGPDMAGRQERKRGWERQQNGVGEERKRGRRDNNTGRVSPKPDGY